MRMLRNNTSNRGGIAIAVQRAPRPVQPFYTFRRIAGACMSQNSTPPLPQSLPDWLRFQQQTHPDAIALGLERVRELLGRLGSPRPPKRGLSIAGTNGKGSTVACADGIARAAGLRAGCYTSPHLLHYNERVRIEGEPVDDARLC